MGQRIDDEIEWQHQQAALRRGNPVIVYSGEWNRLQESMRDLKQRVDRLESKPEG